MLESKGKMGCTASSQINGSENVENEAFIKNKKVNSAIEKRLLLEKNREKNEVKLLLLGAGESGKSTVLKQMKLLHQNGFTFQERQQYCQVIWADAIQSMRILIIQSRKLNIKLSCDEPNSELWKFKQIILRAKVLDQIDTGIAGGCDFLNDYVLKYSERSEIKRRIQSTGRTKALDWDGDEAKEPQEEQVDETEQGKAQEAEQEQEISPGFSNLKLKSSLSTEPDSIVLTRKDIEQAIYELWNKDEGIKRCFNRCNEFQLEGSASYYFDNIFNFADPSYLCTNEDILKGRIKTTGITETTFKIGSSNFKVLDAGGQRSERRKWIHCFQDITAVLFVLAVSEYDQMLFEDERVNRMHEAMMLFDSLCNSKWFINTPFILFLNKIDLFEKKVAISPIKKYFPEYPGSVGDAQAGLKYFEDIFLSLNRTKKPIYVHRTCATDTQSMKFVLSAVTDMIVQQNLKKSGLI